MAEEFLSNSVGSSTSSTRERESIRHVLYGSKRAIARTISILHIKGYAETFEWSKLLPTENPDEYMSILIQSMFLE